MKTFNNYTYQDICTGGYAGGSTQTTQSSNSVSMQLENAQDQIIALTDENTLLLKENKDLKKN